VHEATGSDNNPKLVLTYVHDAKLCSVDIENTPVRTFWVGLWCSVSFHLIHSSFLHSQQKGLRVIGGTEVFETLSQLIEKLTGKHFGLPTVLSSPERNKVSVLDAYASAYHRGDTNASQSSSTTATMHSTTDHLTQPWYHQVALPATTLDSLLENEPVGTFVR
jgi:hypothetical protein